MLVADTTLISYFTIEGDFTEEALAVRKRDPEWAAPLLWRSEFMNVLWLYIQREVFELSLAFEHLDTAEDLIAGRSYQPAPPAVLRLAAESGCSAYDCQYVQLAKDLDVPLVTHDKEVLGAFPRVALRAEDFLGDFRDTPKM